MSRLGRFPALLTFEVGAVITLHVLGGQPFLRVDWRNLSDWLNSTPLDDAIAAALHLAALGTVYWLLFSTLAYLVASFSQRPAAINATSWMTLPAIRRMVSRSVAVSIAASSIAIPLVPAVAGLALGSTTGVEVDDGGVMRPSGTEPAGDQSSGDQGGGGRDILLPPHLQASPDPVLDLKNESAPTLDPTFSYLHQVVHGDHLWSIACQHLEATSGRTNLGEHEIAPYWVRVIEANRSTIRSGDPELIYPGERIVLPPVDG